MKDFLFRKLSTQKGLIIILIVFLIAILIVLQQAKTIRFSELITGFIGIEDKAILSLLPDEGEYKVGDEFSVNVYLNTKKNNVVAIGAYLDYNPSHLQVMSVTTTGSVFDTGYEIINYNGSASHTPTGTIEIIKSKPSPGVNTNKGLVATINFKALAEVSPSSDNVTFSFSGPYATSDSEVILDDGEGTDILSGVNNAKYTIKIEVEYEVIKVRVEMEGKKTFSSSLQLQIFQTGTENVVFQATGTSTELGKLEIETSAVELPAGVYDFKIVVPYYLDKKVTGISWPTEIEIEYDDIPAGDLNDDEIINSLDWSVMSGDWRTSDAISDINEDGIVNTLDWGFLNKNWGKSGD